LREGEVVFRGLGDFGGFDGVGGCLGEIFAVGIFLGVGFFGGIQFSFFLSPSVDLLRRAAKLEVRVPD